MTTDEAFTQMIHTRGMHTRIDRTAKYMTWIRVKNQRHKGISLELKIHLLQKAGFKMLQDIEWGEPKTK
ncbi:MAG: hypothetical protein H0W62_06175 [Chitinophagales bacterium]|nr:hypothetical protein [Chitinophagales bacterium]